MKCPNCNETLLITERHQVEIDYCPSCRGVWLDKGELDKLLTFAAEQNDRPAPRYEERKENYIQEPHNNHYDDRYKDQKYDQRYSSHQHPRKKKSFLSDFFDFD